MVKEIVQIGDPILYEQTKQVTDVNSKEVQEVITDLLDTCKADSKLTAGLAAPQIGHHFAICICRRTDLEDEGVEMTQDEMWEVLINPKVTSHSEKESTVWEACLSIGKGKDMIYGPVSRPNEVTVSYLSTDGEETSLSGKGFFSHLMQHEIDHLNGVLFLEYVHNPKNLWKSGQLDEYLNSHDTYPDIL